MLRHSIRLLLHYLKFWDVPVPTWFISIFNNAISHTRMFMKALEDLGKLTDPMFGNIQPDETVDIYYNLSTDGTGGVQLDERGPWNLESTFKYIADPLNTNS